MDSYIDLFMIFDILGDTERTGPNLWHVDRKRLEDIKNHEFDLIIIYNLIEKLLPVKLDYKKVLQYIICHDLPEAITGDITIFEGVSNEERKRVTDEAINFLGEKYSNLFDLKTIINNFESCADLEAKIAKMLDKVHSATTFIKYEAENHIDYDNPRIIPILRNHPFVDKKIKEGKDIADIFYEFHRQALVITLEECEKFSISRKTADEIEFVIKGFIDEFYYKKLNNSLFDVKETFPESAMKYNRNR